MREGGKEERKEGVERDRKFRKVKIKTYTTTRRKGHRGFDLLVNTWGLYYIPKGFTSLTFY